MELNENAKTFAMQRKGQLISRIASQQNMPHMNAKIFVMPGEHLVIIDLDGDRAHAAL